MGNTGPVNSIPGCFEIKYVKLQLSFPMFVMLLQYTIVEQWRRKEDYIKCELIGGGSSTHLNTTSKLFFIVGCILHTYQCMLCIVAIDDCTHLPCPK